MEFLPNVRLSRSSTDELLVVTDTYKNMRFQLQRACSLYSVKSTGRIQKSLTDKTAVAALIMMNYIGLHRSQAVIRFVILYILQVFFVFFKFLILTLNCR